MSQQIDIEEAIAASEPLAPLQGALDWVSRDLYVFPITAGRKAPPLLPNWENAATTDVAQINQWAREFPNCNWGCAPARSGHVVFDVDRKNGKDGLAELERLAAAHGFEIPDTLTTATPNSGFHFYFRGTAQSTAGRIAPGVDVRSRGGYVLVPGSLLDGNSYTVAHDLEAWDDIPDAPAKLLTLTEAKKTTAQASAASGAPVDAAKLREAGGYLDCEAPYPIWRDHVAGIGAANCAEVREIAHEFSEGRLDRSERFKGEARPGNYTGPEAVDIVLDTMPPKEGGIGVGSINKAAQDAGWKGTLAPREDAAATFNNYLATMATEPEAKSEAPRDNAGGTLLPSYMGAEIGTIVPPRWLIKGFIPTPAVGITFGKYSVFKTTASLDTLDSTLTGTKTFGQFDAEQGDAVLCVGEGLSGLRSRIEARARDHGLTLDQYRLLLVAKVPCFNRPDEWAALVDTIKARGLKPKIICLDHLGIMLAGQDHNDPDVATQAMMVTNELAVYFQCAVVILAHAGKDGEREVRGSSAFLDKVDFGYELTRAEDSDIVKVRCAKMRDGMKLEPFFLKAESRHGAAFLTYASKDDARRAAGKQVGLRRDDVSAALVAMGACPGGANEWTGKAGGIPTRPVAIEVARARIAAEGDNREPAEKEIGVLVMALNRGRARADPSTPMLSGKAAEAASGPLRQARFRRERTMRNSPISKSMIRRMIRVNSGRLIMHRKCVSKSDQAENRVAPRSYGGPDHSKKMIRTNDQEVSLLLDHNSAPLRRALFDQAGRRVNNDPHLRCQNGLLDCRPGNAAAHPICPVRLSGHMAASGAFVFAALQIGQPVSAFRLPRSVRRSFAVPFQRSSVGRDAAASMVPLCWSSNPSAVPSGAGANSQPLAAPASRPGSDAVSFNVASTQ